MRILGLHAHGLAVDPHHDPLDSAAVALEADAVAHLELVELRPGLEPMELLDAPYHPLVEVEVFLQGQLLDVKRHVSLLLPAPLSGT